MDNFATRTPNYAFKFVVIYNEQHSEGFDNKIIKLIVHYHYLN